MSNAEPLPGEILLREEIFVRAPAERCFALSTSIPLVQRTLGFKPQPATGHITAGSHVLWQGWMFGLKHEHLTVISAFDPPRHFRDQMERGRFASFHHDHWFQPGDGGTWMCDELVYRLPFGILGRTVARTVMTPAIRKLMHARFRMLKQIAEGDAWQQFV